MLTKCGLLCIFSSSNLTSLNLEQYPGPFEWKWHLETIILIVRMIIVIGLIIAQHFQWVDLENTYFKEKLYYFLLMFKIQLKVWFLFNFIDIYLMLKSFVLIISTTSFIRHKIYYYYHLYIYLVLDLIITKILQTVIKGV